MRPPDLPGGNYHHKQELSLMHFLASMRPPDLPGGNVHVRLERLE